MEQNEALETVHLRNDFYRDSYRRIMKTLLFSLCLITALVALLGYVVMNPPRPHYFAVDADGRITPIVSLDKPNLSPATLLQWSTQAALAAYSYNFVNYRKELQAASEFFTPNGWKQFIKAIQDSNNLSAITRKKLVMSAVATGAPVIVWSGLLPNQHYGWRVQLPLLVTYQSSSELSQQALVISMLISRVDTLYSARGLGIEQFVAANRNNFR